MKNSLFKSAALKSTASLSFVACCFLSLMAFFSHAQTRGTVEVIKDPRIDTLLERRMQPAKGVRISHNTGGGVTSNISVEGYRVQIYSGGSRAEAYAAQDKFKRRFPDQRTYIAYREPNFKVRAGDYRTRMEASKMMQELRQVFPVLFIIPEKINPPLN